MPSRPSVKSFLQGIRSSIKAELDDLNKFCEGRLDLMPKIEKPDGEYIETGSVLNLKIQRTGERLLQELDDFIDATNPKNNLPVRPPVEPVRRSNKKTGILRRSTRKTKTSS